MGVVGARGGWVVASLFADSLRQCEARVWESRLELFPGLAEIVVKREDHGAVAAVAIGVPIGLYDTVKLRNCDEGAREMLEQRRSSVYAPPARYMLAARYYSALRELLEREQGHQHGAVMPSPQAVGMLAKIRETDDWVRAHRESEAWLWECHPELSFRRLNSDAPLSHDKRSGAGAMRRLVLVRGAFPDAELQLQSAPWSSRRVDLGDLLDAYAALSTAVVCAQGECRELGNNERDAFGLPMRMAM